MTSTKTRRDAGLQSWASLRAIVLTASLLLASPARAADDHRLSRSQEMLVEAESLVRETESIERAAIAATGLV